MSQVKKTKKVPSAKTDLIYGIIGIILIAFSLATLLGLYETTNRNGLITGGLIFGVLFIGASIQNNKIRKRAKKIDSSLDADELIKKYKS